MIKNKFVYLVFSIGILLSIGIHEQVKLSHKNADYDRFLDLANDRFVSFNRVLENELEFIKYLSSFFQTKGNLSRNEFSKLTDALLKAHPEIQALIWAPKVTIKESEDNFGQSENGIHPSFMLKKFSVSTKQKSSTNGGESFPIHYIEPLVRNKHLIGYDLLSNEQIVSTLREAAESQHITISPPVSIISQKQDDLVSLVVVGIYDSQERMTRAKSPVAVQIRGYIIMALKTVDFFQYAITDAFDEDGISVGLEDVFTGSYLGGDKWQNNDSLTDTTFYTEEIIDTGRGLDISVEYEGRLWRLKAKAAEHFDENLEHFEQYQVLYLGLLLSLLISFILHIQQQQNNLIKEQVKLKTKQLADSDALGKSILDTASDAIICMSEEGIISRFNMSAERLFGYSFDEVVGQNVTKLMPIEYAYQHEAGLKNYLLKGKTESIELSRDVLALHKNKSQIPISIAISDTGISGNSRFTGIIHDMSTIKKIEQNLVDAKNKAELADKAKSNFLANVSHEIRTPLNAIIGFTHILRDKPVVEPVEQITKLNKIYDSAHSLLAIINNILDFSKIETGKMLIDVEEMSLEQFYFQLHHRIEEQVSDKGLELKWDLDSDVPNVIMADSLRLSQIILNFVDNAIKFTQQGSVTIRNHLIMKTDTETEICFEVIDTGIGLSKEHQSTIFQAFAQADSSSKRKFGGTGIGLTISNQLAQLMGGYIGVSSELEKGSTFWFVNKFQLPKKVLSIANDESINHQFASQGNNVRGSWKNLRCLDYDQALTFFNGDESLYLAALHNFINEHANDTVALNALLETEDFTQHLNDIHLIIERVIKDSEQLGINGLVQLSKDLNSALKSDRETIKLKMTEMRNYHGKVINSFKQFLPEQLETIKPSEVVDMLEIKEVLKQLHELLMNDDFSSGQFFMSNLPLLQQVFAEEVKDLETHVNNFEAEQSISLVEIMLSQCTE